MRLHSAGLNTDQKNYNREFYALIGITILINYLLPSFIKDTWFILMLYLYSRSRNEIFWFVYFFALNDGIASFFGYRGVSFEIIPFLPDFEVAHAYVIIMLAKLVIPSRFSSVFYSPILRVIVPYMIYLYIFGIYKGVPTDYNIHLRTFRIVTPLLLVYTIPKLFKDLDAYEKIFSYIFQIAIVAFLTQIFTILVGKDPISFLGFEQGYGVEVSATKIYRGFYNVSATLIGFFGSMYYLSLRISPFKKEYLYLVLFSVFGTVFLSATRGWILGLSISLLIYILFIGKIKLLRLPRFYLLAGSIILLLLFIPKLRIQIHNSLQRVSTLELVLEGDMSAGGTVSRATIQGPAVMQVWKQRPILGWGFSDIYYDNQNGHVGNQNLLLNSGIVGALLLAVLFIYFNVAILRRSKYMRLHGYCNRCLYVFPVFFILLFIVHSTSGQIFGYWSTYRNIFSISLYLGIGNAVFNNVTS